MCSEVHNEPLVRGRLNHPGSSTEALNGSEWGCHERRLWRDRGYYNGRERARSSSRDATVVISVRPGDRSECRCCLCADWGFDLHAERQGRKTAFHTKQPRRWFTKETFEMLRTFHRKQQGQKVNISTSWGHGGGHECAGVCPSG